MINRAVAAGSLLLAAGCATGPDPSQLLVSSTANRYVVPAPVEIVAKNQSDQPLFLLPCEEHEERSSGGQWKAIPNPACASIDALVRVAPGATVSIGVPFVGAPGTYRVGVSYATDSSFAAAQQQSFSNSFTVVQ